MKHHVLKFNPSGNTTILVLDPVERSLQPEIAARLMSEKGLAAEQVGFIEAAVRSDAAFRLQMMGGEFCGNAARCAAMAAALKLIPESDSPIPPENRQTICFESSGISGLLKVDVYPTTVPYRCRADIEMPLPRALHHGRKSELGSYSIVAFEGIIHVVLWEQQPAPELIASVERLIRSFGFDSSNFGVMFYETERHFMTPAVSIKQVDSLVWESSCGSGTMALLAARSDIERKTLTAISVYQPGGVLVGSAGWNGNVNRLELSGEIELVLQGNVYVFGA
jgi:diaminopimelate epimerase